MFCPVCGSLAATNDPVTRDGAPPKIYNIGWCAICDARFDQRIININKVGNEATQSLVNYDFYKPNFTESEYENQLAINRGMIEACARFCHNLNVYVEFGVGRGLLTRAAGAIFGRVYGLDLEVDTAKSVGQKPDNVEFWVHQDFLDNSPVDDISALCAWHVIEHLPDPHGVLEPLFRRMQSRSTFFGQVPLFKPEHVIDAHFVWYTEESLIHMGASYGFFPVYFERDEVNDFLSFCFRKK